MYCFAKLPCNNSIETQLHLHPCSKYFLNRFSIKLLSEIDDWTQGQLDALAEKAKIIWGSSELWEKAQLSEMGNIVRKYVERGYECRT